MAKWVYVQAMVDSDFTNGQKVEDTLPVCFRSTIVEAESESLAYAAGFRWGQSQPAQSVLNDYVVAIG
jgi:hypothetical protein